MKKKFVFPLLELVALISGAAIMILGLVASRIITPYLGATIYSWSSLIGIIMISLSLGYWWGGRIADKKANYNLLGRLLLLSGFWIGIIVIIKKPLLYFLVTHLPNYFFSALIGNFLLFFLPIMLLAMISPITTKLKLHNIKNTGKVVGNLTAIATIGSIVGTFLAGYLLIPYLGNSNNLLLLSLLLISIALILSIKNLWIYLIILD